MDNEQGIAISLALHMMVAALLFFWNSNEKVKPSYTSVEMVSLFDSRPAQRQRIKGVKKPKPAEEKPKEDTKDPNQVQTEEKIGNDTEDAPEIQGGSTNPQLLAVANYAQELLSYIQKNRFYPRRALVMEQTGTVVVRLKINAAGEFVKVEVIKPSQHAVLNKAAEDLLTDLKKFKPLPSSYRGNGEFEIPIHYFVEGGI